jgi:hypothetical protein
MDKDKNNALFYIGDDVWELREESETKVKVLKTYKTSDLRMTVVYRGRCFKNEFELDLYHKYKDDPSEIMSLDYILETLKNDMIKRGTSAEALKTMSRLDLAVELLDTYVKYPLPSWETAIIPYNYCALPKLMSGDLA